MPNFLKNDEKFVLVVVEIEWKFMQMTTPHYGAAVAFCIGSPMQHLADSKPIAKL